MRTQTFISSMVGVVAAVAVAGSANAAVAFNGVGANVDGYAGNQGMVFTVGASDILVTHLGAYNGAAEVSTVGIYIYSSPTVTGTTGINVGGTFNVTTTNTDNGSFTYAALNASSFQLTAGQTYIVVNNSSGHNFETTTAAINAAVSGITFNGYRYNYTAPGFDPIMATESGITPQAQYWGTPYIGANFQFSVVPAPGALALLGAAGLIGARRRRD